MDVIWGGLIAIAASALTMIGTLYRDQIQAKRDKKATERQELLAACRAFLRGIEIRRGHLIREWLEKIELPAEVVTEGLHEVIRGNADVKLLTSSRRVADAADELWWSLLREKTDAGVDTNLVNQCRTEFIAAVHEELEMPGLKAPREPFESPGPTQDPNPAPGGSQAGTQAPERRGWWRKVFGG